MTELDILTRENLLDTLGTIASLRKALPTLEYRHTARYAAMRLDAAERNTRFVLTSGIDGDRLDWWRRHISHDIKEASLAVLRIHRII